jgi:hypothetical protein
MSQFVLVTSTLVYYVSMNVRYICIQYIERGDTSTKVVKYKAARFISVKPREN